MLAKLFMVTFFSFEVFFKEHCGQNKAVVFPEYQMFFGEVMFEKDNSSKRGVIIL